MADTHIKINSVTPRVQYTGNGVTTTFPYEFAIFDETDMVVYVDDDIVESGYTVTGAGETEGGTVVFDTAPDDGIKITLLRDVPIERVTDFQEGGTFRPKNLNDEFDRQTAFVQQVQEILDRSVKVGPTSDVDPEEVLSQVERIYSSIDNVDAVADNLTNIYAVASDLSNIDAVVDNQTNIDNVANNANNINSVAGNTTDISNVATNMSDVNDCATNMAAIQDAPNKAQAAADSAALAYQYANDKINQTHISNCITYIPQDIKLELNNGTLTLKAGSKAYIPNGVGVFDEITIASDLTWSLTTYKTGKLTFCVSSDGSQLIPVAEDIQTSSGSSQPTEGSGMFAGFSIWYDTTNNIVKYTDNSFSTYTQASLPIALVLNTQGTGMTPIDQVFNGFGYIGSTVFALPGVKGLIPNGRNADGSLKNIEFTTNKVSVLNISDRNRSDVVVFIKSDGELQVWGRSGGYVTSFKHKPNVAPMTYCRAYIEDENLWYHSLDTTTWGLRDISDNIAELFSVDTDDNGISGVSSMKTTFHALDYNDKGTISGWGMPSSRYIDLTLGADQTTYTAPANGCFTWQVSSTGANQYFGMTNDSSGAIQSIQWTPVNGGGCHGFLPVNKGDVARVTYNATNALTFRFIYAQGEQ